MWRVIGRGCPWFIGAVSLGSILLCPDRIVAQQAPTYDVWEFGVLPRPSLEHVLLSRQAVRREIKLLDDQARGRTPRLDPGQQSRLDQIQLQAQGPLAFGPHNFPDAYSGDPLPLRLGLSDEQARRVGAIAREGADEIQKAASFVIALETKERPPTDEAIRKYVEGPAFQAEKEKARRAGRAAWVAVMGRIEQLLTEAQRGKYRELIGEPFDLGSLMIEERAEERQSDLAAVRQAFSPTPAAGGGSGGQRADPDFDTKVARPAYTGEAMRPRVLFDEAHHNFHTATGRYKPFAQLIGSDGYRVIPNHERFSAEVLGKADILVIANALGAEGMGQPGAADPAFTDAECDAVRDWIMGGGSLLFITDHAPMGSAAECLAKRLGIELSKGATSDPANSEGGETSLIFSRQNKLLTDHPITRGRDDSEKINRIQTFTGTSLKGPDGSVPILRLAETAMDNAYDEEGKAVSAARRCQGLAMPLGNGRVVMLGEAAQMSAQLIGDRKFGMNVPGLDNRQMALNIMHWLSGLIEPKASPRK